MSIRAALLVLLILIGGGSAAYAAGSSAPQRMTTVTFHLRVQATPPPQMTFWVAYGPPAPHFGVVRLHPVGNGQYVGSRALPVGASASFTYLAGWGTVRTRAGAVPGDPVFVIKRTGRVRIGLARLPAVVWRGPRG